VTAACAASGFPGFRTNEMSKRSEIQRGLEKIERGSGGGIALKPEMTQRVTGQNWRIRFDFDNVSRHVWEVGNTFVR
jgi:hypothetical protein